MSNHKQFRLFGQFFEIVCGTNEEFLIGFNINYKEDGTFALKSTFANHSHCSGIRKLAICGSTLVSGGIDEMIHVFNLKRRGKIGVIGEHEGTITDIQQHKQKYIFSSSEDGKICIFKVGVWECEKSLLGHKGSINSIAVHPSGKLALSVGVDKTLHTWDLIKGKKAFVSNLNEVGSIVRWSPSGDRYIVVMHSRLDLYNVESASKIYTADLFVRINEIVFIEENLVAVAMENGKVCIHDTEEGVTLQQWEAHSSRVRAMAPMPTIVTEQEHDMLYLVTGSSDGWVKVWAISRKNFRVAAECITSKNTQCRVTCLCVYSDADYRQALRMKQQDVGPRGKQDKRKRKDDFSEEEDVEYKPVITKKKKKKVSIKVESEEEEEDLADEEEQLLEVIKGEDAMEMLGIETENYGDMEVKRSKRKNKGRPAKRWEGEDSD